MELAQGIVSVAAIYAAIGVVFGILFVTVGAARIDPAAHGAPIGFRLLIFPGSAALWPVLIVKWMTSRRTHP